MKKPSTLNYLINLGDRAKFSRIPTSWTKIFFEHSHFVSYLAMISLLLWQERKAKHCQIFTKNTSEKKIQYSRSIQIELDSSRCGFFMDTILVVGSLGQTNCLGTLIEIGNLDTLKYFSFIFQIWPPGLPTILCRLILSRTFRGLECPECIFDTKDEEYFQLHAIENHPESFQQTSEGRG